MSSGRANPNKPLSLPAPRDDTDANKNRPTSATATNEPANHIVPSPSAGGNEPDDDPQSHVPSVSSHSFGSETLSGSYPSPSPLQNSPDDFGDDRAPRNFHTPPLPRVKVISNGDQPTPVPPVRIAVIGATGSGKTTFINLASGSNQPLSAGLKPGTVKIQPLDEFTLDGRAVTLIDTPEFDNPSEADGILEVIAASLPIIYGEGSKLAGIIYIHRISDRRFTGINGRNFEMYGKLCGDTTFKNLVLVTNMWTTVSPEDGEAFEKELLGNAFELALGKGGHMVRHDGTLQSAHDIIREITKNHPAVPQTQWEVVKHKDSIDTTAGGAINREPDERTGRHQDGLKRAEEDVIQALKEKDEMRKQLEEGGRIVQGWMDGINKRLEGLEKMEREAKKERERTEAELIDLRHRLQDATSASAADRARLEQAEANHNRQLADLTRRLRNEAAAHRAELEQEIEELRDRVATAVAMPSHAISSPTLLPPLQGKPGSSEHQSTVRILVMGATRSGKTSFINLASGSNLPVGMGLEPCTAEVQLSDDFTLGGRRVVLIDTPGFDDASRSDLEVLQMIAAFLATVHEKGFKLAGAIYIHRITDRRFTEIAARNFNMFRELYGDSALGNVVLVTNMWDAVPHEVGEAREGELSDSFFKPVLDGGAQMVRHHNNTDSAHDVIRRITAVDCPVVLRIQRELVDEHKGIVDTCAGKAVNGQLDEQFREHEDEFRRAWNDMMEAFRDRDEEARRELEEEARGLQEQMEKIKKDLEEMAANYAVEKERVEVALEMEPEPEMEQEPEMDQEPEMERQWVEAELMNLSLQLQDATNASMANQVKLEQETRERERIETEHNQQLADLNYRLQEATNASADDRARLEQLVKERELVDAEHEQRLADLTRRLQDEISASVAHRVALEQEVKELQGGVATAVTVPPRAAPSPTLPPPPRRIASASTRPPSVKIIVMGATGSGKTTFINCASGSNLPVGMSLDSSTAEVQVADEFTFEGRTVILIDTPGFDDTTKSDTEILKIIAFFLAAVYEDGSILAGVIYMHRISDNRFGGITGRNFNMFRKICGESTLKNVILVTNMWKEDSQAVNEAREKDLSGKFFKPALDKGAQMVRHYNTTESAYDILRKIVKNHPVVLQIQRELVDERKDIIDTAAGDSINAELKEQTRRHQRELKELREEMKQALQVKDEEMREELGDAKRELEEKVTKVRKASEGVAANYDVEKKNMVDRIREMEEEVKTKREQAEAAYDEKLAAIRKQLERTPTTSADDREGWEQEIKLLQDRLTVPIYDASNREDQSYCTRIYLFTDRVVNVRKELMKEARPRGLFKKQVYVEVVMEGETEGKFLEDPEAHRYEMMGQVSRLVYWTHADIDDEVKLITPTSQGALSRLASLEGGSRYYQRLLSARRARDAFLNHTGGNGR